MSVNNRISKLIISQGCVIELYNDIIKYKPKETGGAIAGFLKGDALYAMKIILGGSKAYRHKVYFKPDDTFIQMELDTEYWNSQELHYYIGDWHSHPEKVPNPSTTDMKSFISISERITDGMRPFFLIIGYIDLTIENFKDNLKIFYPDREIGYVRELYCEII